MNSRALYDQVSQRTSKMVTHSYSTSFSLGIRLLNRKFHDPVYAIYGFVRLADEIVDTFHDHDKRRMLAELRADTWRSIDEGISLNPILNAFQETVRRYQIDRELIATFLDSMEMDLEDREYDRAQFETYVLGSAEVVGLMCLKVFCEGDEGQFESLKAPAMRLGAAFQKINFLRDLKADTQDLGRSYFPGLEPQLLDDESKKRIEAEIEADFTAGYEGIRRLPRGARFGVYVAFRYYRQLFYKIRSLPPRRIMEERIRIPNPQKYLLLLRSYLRHSLNVL